MTITIHPSYLPTDAHYDSRTHCYSCNLKNLRLSDIIAACDETLAEAKRKYTRNILVQAVANHKS